MWGAVVWLLKQIRLMIQDATNNIIQYIDSTASNVEIITAIDQVSADDPDGNIYLFAQEINV